MEEQEFEFKTSESLKVVGYLNKRQGPVKGYEVAEIGHPVYRTKDKYVLFLYSEDGMSILPIAYHLETLTPVIDFL